MRSENFVNICLQLLREYRQWRAETGLNETTDGRKSTGGKNDKGMRLPWRIAKLIHIKPHFKLTRILLGRVYFPEA